MAVASKHLEAIARVVHEAVRAWARSAGDASIKAWNQAPRWQREATLEAIVYRIDNPGAPASEQHDQWASQKRADGWQYGETKDAVRKIHPLLIPYEELPEFERRKDALVGAVIDSLTRPLD